MIRRWIYSAIFFAVLFAHPAFAEEIIHSFHADITVNRDGSLDVTETIEVTAEGNKIRRGIFRDFPTAKFNSLGFRKNYPFEVKSIQRDGEREDYHIDGNQGFMMDVTRVYIGRESFMLPKGRYTYTLTYHTDGWLFSDGERDELYWNITGNAWDFRIEDVSATIHLPKSYADQNITVNGWTGYEGGKGEEWKLVSKSDGLVEVEATSQFNPSEGMTIAVFWPSGDVDFTSSQFSWKDNMSAAFAFLGLMATFGVFWYGWVLVGKDPEGRPEETTSTPPADLSPALARQLSQMKYDNECLSAALISAGAKGAISIHEDEKFLGKTFVIKRENDTMFDQLSADERILAHQLLKSDNEIELKQSNRTRIRSAVNKFEEYLKETLVGPYYNKNSKWVWYGTLTAVLFHGLAVLTAMSPAIAGFITIWLTFWSCAVAGLLWVVYAAWKAAFGSGSPIKLLGAMGITLFATPFCIGEGFGLFMLSLSSSIWVALSFPIYIALIIFFIQWMKAPTPEGRALLDQLDGYKRWLTDQLPQLVSETADDEETRRLVDEHLPWITALDLGGTWGEKIASAVGSASTENQSSHWHRHPHWYHGNHWNGLHSMGDFTSSISSGVSSAMTSSTSSSSSSEGGGSSGGGGGGGGGGGW